MPIRSFSRLALVFVALFATLVAGSLFPLKPLDPAWQSQVIGALVNSATLPLLAVALLHLGVLLDPEDPRLQERYQLFCRLAAAASLGFLLLVPLQISAGLRLQQSTGSQQIQRLDQAQRKLSQFRTALGQATSSADLSQRLQRLNGPALSPADLTLPLPVLKAQVTNVFNQAQSQINLERSALPSADPLRLLPLLLRGSAACLALTFGFAIFALRPGSEEIPLLDELLLSWQNTGAKRKQRALSRTITDEAYIRQIHEEEEG